MFDSENQDSRNILSVTQLTEQIKITLEDAFPTILLSGEISNLSRPQSGHCYFTLKDERSQIRAVIWRGVASKLPFQLDDGQQVIVTGHVEVYGPRGSYQFICSRVEPAGLGPLELALRQLKEKLAKEGLFDPARKKRLNPFPKRIAFVTSPTGAAIRDFLEVLGRRFRGTDVLIAPVRVQGDNAAMEIAGAIEMVNNLNANPPIDTIVVGRGGGSLEDLWSFNEEIVARAIARSEIPVISAVGHEIDVSISDLVADVRAATPSEAAELAVPSSESISGLLSQLKNRLVSGLRNRANHARLKLERIERSRFFSHPYEKLHEHEQYLDELSARADSAIRLQIEREKHALGSMAAQLEALSPLAVLQRGYSITLDSENENPIRDTKTIEVGQKIKTKLANGSLVSMIEEIKSDDE